VWGVIFSLRNENIYDLFFDPNLRTFFVDWILGGQGRYPNNKVEMMPFDILAYFGVLGLFLSIKLLIKIIPNWTWGIPIFVACFGGGIYEAPLGILLFFLTLTLVKKG
jgi:hypothetical protein